MTDQPENKRKDIFNNEIGNQLVEVIEILHPEFFYEPRQILNVFAGNLGESVLFFNLLVSKDSKKSKITAVDIEKPVVNRVEKLTIPEGFTKPEFILADAFQYLNGTASPLSVDVLTAYGAEFLFRLGDTSNNESFKDGVLRVLKLGGIVHCPFIPALDNDPRFEKILNGVYKRVDPEKKRYIS